MPDRSMPAVTGAGGSGRFGDRAGQSRWRDRALDVLCNPDLAHVVDLLAYRDGDAVVVANAAGACRCPPAAGGDWPAAELVHGRHPLPDQDPLAFWPRSAELADPSPPNERNAYPYASARLHSLFAEPRAPDIAVVHTARHYWPDRGGHLGEHGSLDVVQSRAPLILSGAGVLDRGVLRAAARVVDIGPTLAWLAGVPLGRLAGLDGAALVDLAVPRPVRHVVGLLWDGANSNALLGLAAAGELPAVGRLLDRGVALAGGAVAEFPSVTLVNHASALTGVGPGRHGIVNNFFFDRASGCGVAANASSSWHNAMELIRPGVSTVFQWLAGEMTACVNEPVDAGAGYSTFALVRASGSSNGAADLGSLLPDPTRDPHATGEWVAADAAYAWSTQVDAMGLQQVLHLWPSAAAAPRLTWWNTTLTDSGHHAAGPHSAIADAALRDADRRLGVFLDHLEGLGVLDRCVFLLTADHGSEGADPTCRGDWDAALTEAGVPFRDEACGFIYLDG
jgi:phosphonoacetate hydrolase